MNSTITFLKPSLLIRAEAGGLYVAVAAQAAAAVTKPRPAVNPSGTRASRTSRA